MLTGCVPIDPESPVAETESALTESNVYVDSVEIENRDGQYYAIVSGNFADSCTEISDVTTEVDGNSLLVTTSATKPADAMCAQVLTPFEKVIPLDVGELDAGEYSVAVDGVKTSFTVGEDADMTEPVLVESNAYIDSVEVESRDGAYYATISGSLADSCTEVTDFTTEVDGSSVMLTAVASKPADAICAQVLTPFEETVPLDTSDLGPGEYSLSIDGVETSFTIGEEAAAAGLEPAFTESSIFVDSVTVENRDGEYYAVVSGNFADSCTTFSDVMVMTGENTITVDVQAARPLDAICAQVLTPFEEEIKLEIDDVESGEYTVTVNEATTTFTVLP
jgi:hypothetical protein